MKSIVTRGWRNECVPSPGCVERRTVPCRSKVMRKSCFSMTLRRHLMKVMKAGRDPVGATKHCLWISNQRFYYFLPCQSVPSKRFLNRLCSRRCNVQRGRKKKSNSICSCVAVRVVAFGKREIYESYVESRNSSIPGEKCIPRSRLRSY